MMLNESSLDAVAITEHLRDLQDEKKKLENKLDHLRVHRKDLETKYETVSRKNLSLNQKNDAMKRMVNVAKMKVQETKLQVDKYQENSDELQKSVNELKDRIAKEEKKKEDMLYSFLEQFDEIGDRFRNAKVYYTDDKLIEENSRWRSSCEKKIEQAKENEEIVKAVSERLSKVKLQKVPEEKPAQTIWQQFNEQSNTVKDIFRENEVASEGLVRKTDERVKIVSSSLLDIEERLSRLKQEISSDV